MSSTLASISLGSTMLISLIRASFMVCSLGIHFNTADFRFSYSCRSSFSTEFWWKRLREADSSVYAAHRQYRSLEFIFIPSAKRCSWRNLLDTGLFLDPGNAFHKG